MKKWWLAAVMGICSQMAFASGPIVHVQTGRIEGAVNNGVEQFLGIPYAKPPVGELRWQRPLSAQSWSGIRQTTQFGPSCMQKPFAEDAVPLPNNYSEDCLTLNVWRPEKRKPRMPVMVWIHGGGFVNGGSASSVYDGEQFARKGIVFVSFNYRLGRLGFFAHPALAKNMFRGNYGLMDQIKALRWVQDNIASFGGDPAKVTIVGESAGGFSVNTLLTSHYSRDLFGQAIVESGNGRVNLSGDMSWDQAADIGVAFAKAHGIEGTDKAALEKLRELPAADVANMSMMEMGQYADTYSGPMVDGRVIAGRPQDFYKKGDFAHLPLIIGSNDYDLGIPQSQPTTIDEALQVFGPLQDAAHQAYQSFDSVDDLTHQIAMQQMMTEPARFVARQFEFHHVPSWEFRFNYVADVRKGQWPGAQHASEIPYAFDTLSSTYGDNVSQSDQAMATLMHQYWVNFVKHGNPNGAHLAHWPQYHTQKDQLMIFSADGAKASGAVRDPMKAQLDLIEQIQPQ